MWGVQLMHVVAGTGRYITLITHRASMRKRPETINVLRSVLVPRVEGWRTTKCNKRARV